MNEFFKRCGIGIVVIVTSPLWLAFFAFFIVIGTLILIFSPIKLIINLFKHKKLTIRDEYDEKADEILKAQQNASNNSLNSPAPTNTVVYVTPPPVNPVPSPFQSMPYNANYQPNNNQMNPNYMQGQYPSSPNQNNALPNNPYYPPNNNMNPNNQNANPNMNNGYPYNPNNGMNGNNGGQF